MSSLKRREDAQKAFEQSLVVFFRRDSLFKFIFFLQILGYLFRHPNLLHIQTTSGQIMMEVDSSPPEEDSGDVTKNGSGGSSKSQCIRSLLLEAWKNRWSEIEWGINIKKVLPRGVSGDVYDLAEGILQQSLVGMTPNKLMLSYLTHSLNAGIVSFGAVIGAIASYNDFGKQECISALLDLLLSFKHKIMAGSVTGLGNEEECIRLTTSLVSVCSWSFQYLKHASQIISEARRQSGASLPPQAHHQSSVGPVIGCKQVIANADKACKFLSYFSSNSFLISLFNVGKNEDIEGYQRLCTIFKEFSDLEKKNSMISSSLESPPSFERVLRFLDFIDWTPDTPANLVFEQLSSGHFFGKNSCSNTNNPCSSVFSSLNSVIAFNAVLNPVSDVESIASSLLKIAKYNGLSLGDLCMEIIRACFIGLVDAGSERSSSSSGEELKWAAFTFLKMPQILSKLESMTRGETDYSIIEEGLEKLLTFSPLLDQTDCKSNCDCLSLFMNELKKLNLISESKLKQLEGKRQSESAKSCLLGRKTSISTGSSPNQPPSVLILKAETLVTTILDALNGDYSKNQDPLLQVLCHMPGKSFELILVYAAATGKLRHFTMKLLKFNEFNKEVAGEIEKASHTRALLFDITFLMLCQISQNYGTEVITSIEETQDSFFAKWCSQCLPRDGNYRCPDRILANCDSDQVDLLLTQLVNSTDNEFKTSSIKWDDYCINLPAAIKEILFAWESDAISSDEVKRILDYIKSNMCCLSITVSAWLCSYINISHHEKGSKPLEMLQQLSVPSTTVANETDPPSIFYKERSTLMCSIMKKMMSDLIPHENDTKSNNDSHYGLSSKISLSEMMETTFNAIHSRSWLDIKSTHEIENLVSVGGSEWFVEAVVRQLLKRDHANDLNRAVGLIFGLMHINLTECSMALVSKVIPSYLVSSSKQELLFEPKASALARLTVLTICSALDAKRRKCLKKDNELETQMQDTPYMLQRQHQLKSKETGSHSEDDPLRDPFVKAVANLILLFSSVAADPDVSQRTVFPIIFLEQLIMCVKHESQKILQFLPLDTSMSLIRTSPENVSCELLVTLCGLQTLKARKTLARGLCQLSRVKKMQA